MTTHGHLPKSPLPRSRVPGTATGNALAQGARRSPASAEGEAFDLQASAGNLAVAGLLAEGRAAYDGWERAGIDQGARARFEAGFGEDFSAVRIEPASERGAFPRARAVTEEEVIRIHRSLVNRGDQTVRVIGHELAHVVQSRRGHVRVDAFDDNERGRERHDVASDHAARLALDREADTAAGRVTRGQHASIRAGSGVPQAQTWEWPSADEIREGLEDAALTVTLGPLAGTILATTTTSEERAAAVESSRQAVNSAVNWVEDTGAAIDEFVVEQVGDVPVVGHLARGATAYRAFQSEVAGGAVKAVSDIAHGLGGAAAQPGEHRRRARGRRRAAQSAVVDPSRGYRDRWRSPERRVARGCRPSRAGTARGDRDDALQCRDPGVSGVDRAGTVWRSAGTAPGRHRQFLLAGRTRHEGGQPHQGGPDDAPRWRHDEGTRCQHAHLAPRPTWTPTSGFPAATEHTGSTRARARTTHGTDPDPGTSGSRPGHDPATWARIAHHDTRRCPSPHTCAGAARSDGTPATALHVAAEHPPAGPDAPRVGDRRPATTGNTNGWRRSASTASARDGPRVARGRHLLAPSESTGATSEASNRVEPRGTAAAANAETAARPGERER